MYKENGIVCWVRQTHLELPALWNSAASYVLAELFMWLSSNLFLLKVDQVRFSFLNSKSTSEKSGNLDWNWLVNDCAKYVGMDLGAVNL